MLGVLQSCAMPVSVVAAWLSGFFLYEVRRGRPYFALLLFVSGCLLYYTWKNYGLLYSFLAFLHGSRIRCIGLTGNIACGKSAVSARLAELGAYIIDADAIARDVVHPEQPAYKKLLKRFGGAIVDENGYLDRRALRDIISQDAVARKFVNSVTHPAIAMEMLRRIAWHRWILGKKVVVDAPLLFESGPFLRILCAPIIVVTCDSDKQIARLVARDSCTVEAAAQMIQTQMPQDEKAKRADIILRNNKSLQDLRTTVDLLWKDALA